MTNPTEIASCAEGVQKAFGDNKVLNGVSFAVPQGSATTIIGPSGSGKTTLLRALNALDVPDAGVVRVGDVEVDFSKPVSKDQLRRYRAQSGFVFQSHNLFPHKTVLENVIEGPVIVQKRPKDEAEAEAVELLSRSGSPRSGTSTRSSSRAASSSASASRGRWRSSRRWCSSTSRLRRWIPNSSARCFR